jgi:hypothetical protein
VHKVRLGIRKPLLYGGKINSIRVVQQNNECELARVRPFEKLEWARALTGAGVVWF